MVSLNLKKSNFNYGFTLAEVLITLVIIGIIAAMTIPTLMKNTQNQELVTGLKKANSTLSQAIVNMARNNDASPGDYTFLNNVDFTDEFAKVTNTLKICNNTAQCFGSSLNGGGVYKLLNKSAFSVVDAKSVITADGQVLSYMSQSLNRSELPGMGFSSEDADNSIGRIIIDVNGQKGPNVLGRDVYYFIVVNGKGIVPGGSASQNDCNKTGRGYTCAGKILKENAMNY